ncbi:Alpha/Beta hydrolase protein [Yarrowia lipolytica]|jgi:homoserine O-acetyltransferase|uniref:YALI0E00836p n=2 Tax=Yarrowia lipolytica TaxID=4952 RepID=Q6C7H3_YARLI|nr:YALI0E00836p [Yarrowia lipolytica CLIB122]AOW04779.1 hypothetical protein YALI1_E01235g [Yarrowia lipolytica]KAB8282833.1 Alpha/Beta hydrolase protein [Yarrowia lipolytica]KAE8174556.1 Alpha/Beta hydrolase protein [Yarrowia lipolytica]KAJ8056362.1 Alpha/Beta hydrolase protein [Yarrowia lipolytica]QNQ00432.1 Homoserine O-acetyltransferase [Yarrowia lipolytica]|eukprot:XP_503389.1 YALI0E00836p [Yarrowia lipolytica CLIB122]
MKFRRTKVVKENPFSGLVSDQEIAHVPEYQLESGVTIYNVPIAYKTWGVLNEAGNNAMVICHALTGSADVSDWWGPLIGPGRAFDPTRFFIVCLNSLGSPYGSASPCTADNTPGADKNTYYGPEFPLVTVRDDVNIHRLVLDDLGIKQIACCIGGSMGGMLTLEYAFFGKDYVRTFVALATSARHSAWCISWGEAQRQCIYSDPKYDDGYYSFEDPPSSGLGAARMAALLTYRSRDSFENKFGRDTPDPTRHKTINGPQRRGPQTASEEHWLIHNDGHMRGKKMADEEGSSTPTANGVSQPSSVSTNGSILDDTSSVSSSSSFVPLAVKKKPPTHFSAQNYLRYQSDKFTKRFDANCYIAITRKLDTHDVSRERAESVEAALQTLEQNALIIGIKSDGLFTFAEQELIAANVKNSHLVTIDSPEGHDAFLLDFALINKEIVEFLAANVPDIINTNGVSWEEAKVGELGKSSLFGEAEVEITQW